jgi:hypothetical protein
MSVLDWILAGILIVLYLGLLITVCTLTFQKGYVVLGIVGIFIPWLWLIGALLPAKPGSRYEVKEAMRLRTLAQPGSGAQTIQARQAGPATPEQRSGWYGCMTLGRRALSGATVRSPLRRRAIALGRLLSIRSIGSEESPSTPLHRPFKVCQMLHVATERIT